MTRIAVHPVAEPSSVARMLLFPVCGRVSTLCRRVRLEARDREQEEAIRKRYKELEQSLEQGQE